MSAAAEPAPLVRGAAGHAARPVSGGRRQLLHVFPNFNIGGAQVRFAALVAGLGDRFRHTVVSLGDTYEASALIPPVHPVWYASPFPKAGGLIRRLAAYRARLDSLRPDLLVTYNWGAMEVALANLPRRTPHLHMEDGFGPEEAAAQLRRRVWTRRVALARSDVIVPSVTLQSIATHAWRLPNRRVHYIPNGLAGLAEPSTPLASLHMELPAARPCIVWVGALRPEKNPLRLLRAFAPLKDRAQLLLIGDGPERAALLEEAGRLSLGASLHMAGRRDDARDLIMQADILALSSDTEQMPFAVLEAMDAGLPVAATDVGDVRRMTASENGPFIVPPSDAALGRALQALVDDPALRARIGQANRTRVRSIYTLEGMVEAHGALIDRIISRQGTRRAHA